MEGGPGRPAPGAGCGLKARIAAWLQELLGITALRSELAAERSSAEWRFREVARGHNEQTDLFNVTASQSAAREAAIEQGVDRLEDLVKPRAARLHTAGPDRSDWDALQYDFLKEVEG